MAWLGRETAEEQQRAEAWREWFVRQHPLALASLVLSVFSFTHLGTLWVDEIAGIILGVLAIRAVKRGASRKTITLAFIGIVVGALSLICAIIIYALPLTAWHATRS
jgi:uncharacterized membrane protein